MHTILKIIMILILFLLLMNNIETFDSFDSYNTIKQFENPYNIDLWRNGDDQYFEYIGKKGKYKRRIIVNYGLI